MTTVKFQTARVHWRMGQALLPAHFRTQEDSLREDLLLRLRLLPMPFWGVAGLRWDSFQLLKGGVSLRQLTLLLPDGTLVDIPGNTAPASFNLNTTGASHTPLYLHLLGGERDAVVVDATPDVEQEDAVERRVQQVVLSSNPYSDATFHSFKLAEFEKAPDGTWAASGAFIPPLVRVSGSPFFELALQRIRSLVATLHQVLLDEVQENYLAGESLMAARECLKGLYRFKAVLANLEKDVQPHPFELFRPLHELYIDVCMLRGTAPAAGVELYEHERLGPCFKLLLDQLESQVQLARSATPYVPFTRREGLQVCVLPEAARKARRVYWLLQKPSIGSRLELGWLKLASESRLAVVHQLALRGIPFHRIENPPFHHPFSSEVEFYALSEGAEWDHAVREGVLTFFHRPELESVKAFIFWRDE